MPALAPLLRRLREAAGLTQEELAERAGVSTRTVSDAERGLRRRVYADTAARLADALTLGGPDLDSFLAAARGRRDASPDPGGLPHPLTPLLGRSAELAAVATDLAPDSSRRLVTVTGLGGAGKTRLAIAAAAHLQARYGDNLRFVPLAAVAQDQLDVAVAAALSTVPGRIAAAVGDRPTLIVLDAFEHVLSASDWLARFLEGTPSIRALVTSRVRLGIAGEREVALGPLDAGDAARLFLDRAHDLGSDLDGDTDAIADICALTSGLPLPLELAAAQVRYLPLDVLRDRLRIGIADANHVVQDAVEWSISSLTKVDREVLVAAAMFVGGCRLEALEAVCAPTDVVPSLGHLVDRSLVSLDQNGALPRWRMLDAVREAATRLTADHGQRRDAYTAYYLRLLSDAESQLGHEHAWYQQLAAEEANVRTALGWAQARNDAGTLLALATGMWLFWQSRGALGEGRRWLSVGLTMTPRADANLRGTALWGLGWLAYHQGDDDAAARAGRELAELADIDHRDLSRRNALTIAGMVAIARDQPAEAVALLGEALQLARAGDNAWILATSLLNLGLAQLAARSSQDARDLLGEALRHYDAIGDLRFRARSVGYLGLASLLEQEPERAGALFLQSFSTFRDLGEPAGSAEALAGLAAVEAHTGDPATAAVLAGAAERIRDSVAARELPIERRVAAEYLGRARTELGPEAWAQAWQRGRRLDPGDVLDELSRAGPRRRE